MDEMAAQIEIWKKIVDVQQHFNDLELRIRNFALIVTGAFLGLGANALKDGGTATINGHHIPTAALIVAASLVPLLAFYLMDRLWYHRLLKGAVNAGTQAEKKLTELGLAVDLGTQISLASPFTVFKKSVHSHHKMDGFYILLLLSIASLGLTLALAVRPSTVIAGTPSHVTQAQGLDEAAADAVCKAYVQDLLNHSAGVPGSTATDPGTGRQAVLVSGRWRLVPRC
ncbi:hypothetical protein [Peristeroidobacter soli]|uniref:hypothetical protein n=1 Tax=Peristeroidobacter soli TaxID=2497877 RepID=UPI00101DA8E2|nr:hypothetical protein [Peristeroidobacter soli]